MKITKEEKYLYKFLDIINKIFGRTSNRTYLIGRGDSLYFYTLGYCGVFVSKEDNQCILDEYDFERKEYQLKQLPSKEYVIDQYDYEADVIPNVINFINNRCDDTVWQMELFKGYQCKAAKIAVHTNKWMRDDDLALLKSFEQWEVYTCGDGLLFNFRNEICNIHLIFMDSVVAPDNDDATQLKLQEIETSLIQTRINVEESTEIVSPAENIQTGIIEPVEDIGSQNVSKEEIEHDEEYDDPME